MSYQIKSTPFFRRMLNTSKKNGQLQRLKEEYERIKEFNDRTIEMKMRQVRLKRLFREIEEIKESSSQWKRRRISSDKAKTNEEIRMETFVKAKELGKEYSKMNALVDRCSSKTDTPMFGFAAPNVSHTKLDVERKARTVKRISYGNEISRNNIQKLALSPKKQPPPRQLPPEEYLRQKEKLKQRISYGNNCSGKNLSKIAKRDEKHKVVTEVMAALPEVITMADADTMQDDEPTMVELPVKETRLFRTFDELQASHITHLTPSNPFAPKVDDDAHQRARKHWRKLALTVCNRLDSMRRRHYRLPDMISEPATEEYRLRSISNDTHLPMSQISVKVKLPISDGNDDTLPGEVLVGVERLFDLKSSAMLMPLLKAHSSEPPSPSPSPTSNGNETETEDVPSFFNTSTTMTEVTCDQSNNERTPEMTQRVQKYVKLLEPFVRQAAQKEVFEFGVHKLRSIFEHQRND